MNTKKKFLFTFLVIGMLFMLVVPSAFAATITIPSSETRALQDAISQAPTGNGQVPFRVTLDPKKNTDSSQTEATLITFEQSSGRVTFNEDAFSNATNASRQKALGDFVNVLSNSSVSQQTQQNIIDNMSDVNSDVSRLMIPLVMDSTSADLFTAMRWVAPVLPIIRVVFGVGAIIISLALIGSTIVDLVFIGLPIAREGMQNRADSNGGGTNGKIPFVSADAVSVIKESESSLDSSGGYKNVYLMYFKRRVLTYIILSICLLYLVVGELGGLIGWVLSLGGGIVGGN